jgi:hypothetical protein
VLGDFKRHREGILFEREQGLMPATQQEVRAKCEAFFEKFKLEFAGCL